MNAQTRHYLFAAIFLAVSAYKFVKVDALEGTLYGMGGLAFLCNALIGIEKLERFKKMLTVLTWVLLVGALILFLYDLQFRF